MTNTPEMIESVNAFILADRRLTIEDISEHLGNSVGTAHKILHDDLGFIKVSCYSVLPGQRKVSSCRKNKENHQSKWLGAATTFLLLFKFGPLKFSSDNKVKGAVVKWLRISMLKKYISLFFNGKMCFKELRLY